MQTSKLFLVVCGFTLLVGVLYPRADETEAQKRAREALRQKMQEVEGQPQPAAPPAPEAPKPPPAAPPRAVVPATPPQAAPVAVLPTLSADTPAQARARVALRQAMSEWPGEPTGTPGVFAATSGAALAPAGLDNPAQARAREAMWQKIRELSAQQTGVVAYQPIAPPPAAISGSKAGRLAELLSRYRVDLITPEEYHKQRATILAEP